MAENDVLYDYLDKDGVFKLTKGIFETVNSRINERITTTIDENSDNAHVPSAAAVYSALTNVSKREFVKTEDHTAIQDPSTEVIYIEPTGETDMYSMYIYEEEDGVYKWKLLGADKMDLSNYWSKTDADVQELIERIGLTDINESVTQVNERVTAVETSVTDLSTTVENVTADIEKKVDHDEMKLIQSKSIIKLINDAANDTNPFATAADSGAEISDIITSAIESGKSDVAITITEDIVVDNAAPIKIPAGVKTTINIPDAATVTAANESFTVAAGANLVLNGAGTIVKTGKQSNAAVAVEPGGTLTIDGITIDATTQGTDNNYAYGVYAKEDSTINFKSGVIKVAQASAISTNNTTGGAAINISGGELYSDGSYAIYQAAQKGTINITGGIVQGINARMGNINIEGDAKIIPTTIDESNYDDIGSNIATSGCIWFGDTIAIVAGTYNTSENDIVLNISEDATVESKFRSAVGVYMVDTKDPVDVTINVENGEAITTTGEGFTALKVYDHDYISAAATAAGKTYNPVGTSNISITVNGNPVTV